MKFVQRSLLALLVAGLMAIPAAAQMGQAGANERPDRAAQSQSQSGSQADMNGPRGDMDTSAQGAMSDDQFLKKAAESDLAEIQMAQLAQQKASSQQVKDVASKLLDDHQKDLNDVKSIAEQKKITLPDQPDAKDQKVKAKLEKLDGAQFDRAFTKEQVKDHEKDLRLYQQQARNAKDQDVKSYAQKDVAVLQQHLQMAESAEGGHHHNKQANNQTPNSSMR